MNIPRDNQESEPCPSLFKEEIEIIVGDRGTISPNSVAQGCKCFLEFWTSNVAPKGEGPMNSNSHPPKDLLTLLCGILAIMNNVP